MADQPLKGYSATFAGVWLVCRVKGAVASNEERFWGPDSWVSLSMCPRLCLPFLRRVWAIPGAKFTKTTTEPDRGLGHRTLLDAAGKFQCVLVRASQKPLCAGARGAG